MLGRSPGPATRKGSGSGSVDAREAPSRGRVSGGRRAMPESSAVTSATSSSSGGGTSSWTVRACVLGGREQRLSALLALTGHQSARSQVAGILWPESTDARALASLRRAVLQTQRRSPGLLRADRTSIGLHPDVRVDVDELRAATASRRARRSRIGDCSPPWSAASCCRTGTTNGSSPSASGSSSSGSGPSSSWPAEHSTAGTRASPSTRRAPSRASIRCSSRRASSPSGGTWCRGDRASAARELERYCDLVHDELGESPSPALMALLAPPRAAAPPPPEVPRPRPAAEVHQEVPRPRAAAEARAEEPRPRPGAECRG